MLSNTTIKSLRFFTRKILLNLGLHFFTLTLAVSVAANPCRLGKFEFEYGSPSGPLLQNLIAPQAGLPGSLDSYAFVGKVGGVAFAGSAKPAALYNPSSVSLSYQTSHPDGSRLEVRLGDNRARAPLPDWMLIPIARYVDSNYNACVSLFGPNTTDNQYDIIYHPAFLDTLLGLRLLQADLLLIDLESTWQLPECNGVEALGSGEQRPVNMNRDAAIDIQNALAGRRFQSWVFTDGNVQTDFSVHDGKLSFVGAPYYHFWIADMESYRQLHDAFVARANSLRHDVLQYNAIVSQANALEPKVSPVSDITANLRGTSRAIQDFNPAVFNAAANTMWYSAFFRYVKKKDPDAWSAFLTEVRDLPLLPSIRTPTKLRR